MRVPTGSAGRVGTRKSPYCNLRKQHSGRDPCKPVYYIVFSWHTRTYEVDLPLTTLPDRAWPRYPPVRSRTCIRSRTHTLKPRHRHSPEAQYHRGSKRRPWASPTPPFQGQETPALPSMPYRSRARIWGKCTPSVGRASLPPITVPRSRRKGRVGQGRAPRRPDMEHGVRREVESAERATRSTSVRHSFLFSAPRGRF